MFLINLFVLFLFISSTLSIYHHPFKPNNRPIHKIYDHYRTTYHNRPYFSEKLLQLSSSAFYDQEKSKSNELIRNNRISTLIGVSYLSIIASVMTLPSVLNLIDSDSVFQQVGPNIPLEVTVTVATLCIMFGKFSLGPLTDSMGGSKMLYWSMIVITTSLVVCGSTSSSLVFMVFWSLINLSYATTWGAVSFLIRESFQPSEWSYQLGSAAGFSRVGALMSSLVFGLILNRTQSLASSSSTWSLPNILSNGIITFSGNMVWRSIFFSSALFQLIVMIWFRFNSDYYTSVTNSSLKSKHIPDRMDDSTNLFLKDMIKNSKFWLMLLAKASLMMVGHIMSFIPMYLATGPSKLSSSTAAATSSIFSVGSLLANIYGAKVYDQYTEIRKRRIIRLFNIVGMLIPLFLALLQYQVLFSVLNIHNIVVLLLIGLWGAVWALPFYIPPGLVALKIGGKDHAALVTNIFDAIGFFAGAVFSYFAMVSGKSGQWLPVMLVCSIANGIAIITMDQALTDK